MNKYWVITYQIERVETVITDMNPAQFIVYYEKYKATKIVIIFAIETELSFKDYDRYGFVKYE